MPNNAVQKQESYAAVLVPQGKHRFYSLAMPIEVLAETCFVTTREQDPEKGFQRLLDEKRAKEIAQYIDSGLGTIPTNVVLSAQPNAGFHYDSEKKTISFNLMPNAFLVLDGQHRVFGFRLAKTSLRVPVVIYDGLSRLEESKLFIDINTKQRPVPNELLLDIKKLADDESEIEAYSGNLFDKFAKESSSVLKGLMSSSKRTRGQISRVTFYRAFKPILSKIMDNNDDAVFPALNAYFGAVKQSLATKREEEALANPKFFGALVLLFPEIADLVALKYGRKYTLDNFKDALEPLHTKLRISTPKRYGSAKQLYDHLSQSLRVKTLRL